MNHFRPSINVFLLREEVCRDGQNICEQQQQQWRLPVNSDEYKNKFMKLTQ